ncbi:hypothetical protein DFP93_102111 [Aneurinibacillus soli]|uniref:Uncharacterized protein n=1 Tax=Aneurinibacillus soli TaxID=1500254 RepID=A0A0U4WG23_9BACL|nr:hypothetical protein [Aneurinibacillus soli]PYE63427.1 hypothetical protein DFP93_102111 [Aneurinibacillus soli]BAU27641.1 hypothetical protein CB4_01815 [Aneurinibacillus soli]
MARIEQQGNELWMIEEEGEWLYGMVEEKQEETSVDQQQEALDAIMSGLMDTSVQSADANEAIMSALIDIQAQIDEIKNGGGV